MTGSLTAFIPSVGALNFNGSRSPGGEDCGGEAFDVVNTLFMIEESGTGGMEGFGGRLIWECESMGADGPGVGGSDVTLVDVDMLLGRLAS